MNSSFEVYYFPFQLKADPIRLLLAYSGANWSNKIISNWKEEKFTTEGLIYHQVPMLIEKLTDGSEFRLVQCSSIAKYIAACFNLIPNNERQKAMLDSYYNGIQDIRDVMVSDFMRCKPEEINTVIQKHREPNSSLAKFLNENEKILEKNLNGNGHFLGEETTYVDIFAYSFVRIVNNFPGMTNYINISNAPLLMKVYNNIASNKNIIEYEKDLTKNLIHSPINPIIIN